MDERTRNINRQTALKAAVELYKGRDINLGLMLADAERMHQWLINDVNRPTANETIDKFNKKYNDEFADLMK